MKKIFLLITIITFLIIGCKTTNVQYGTWNYDIVVNNTIVGNALVTLKQTDEHNISTTTTNSSFGKIRSYSKQMIIETRDFKPVEYLQSNTVVTNGKKRVMKTIAKLKGNTIHLRTGDLKYRKTFKKPFIFNGYYFYFELLDKGFDKETTITADMYEPSIEVDRLVKVKAHLKGKEKVKVRNETKELYHIRLSIENIKYSDVYMNLAGVTELMRVKQLNNVIELIIRK